MMFDGIDDTHAHDLMRNIAQVLLHQVWKTQEHSFLNLCLLTSEIWIHVDLRFGIVGSIIFYGVHDTDSFAVIVL